MTKDKIQSLSALALLRLVFGYHSGQTLSTFSAEMATIKTDEKFMAEVRDYALTLPESVS